MKRRAFIASLTGGLLAAPLAVEAQQAGKVRRIGYLSPAAEYNPIDRAFDQAMGELGYREGQNIVVERRFTSGQADRFSGFAAELVGLNPDVIVVWSPSGTLAMKRATTAIPVVFLAATDPVAAGIVNSLARPGGHMTGVSFLAAGMLPKRLQLLKEMLPSLSRVAVLRFGEYPGHQWWPEIERAAQPLHLSLARYEVRLPEELGTTFRAIKSWGANALMILNATLAYPYRQQLADLALRHRLPTMHPFREGVEAGCLMSYAPSLWDMARHGAEYVAKILKGAKPADLPVEQPTKFDLVINLKTAKALGLTIPPSVLARADEIIE